MRLNWFPAQPRAAADPDGKMAIWPINQLKLKEISRISILIYITIRLSKFFM